MGMPKPHLRVVVVEHDRSVREAINDALERAGYDVIAVNSGADALAFLLRTSEACTVLLDLRSDHADGWEVLSILRTVSARSHRVVILSGGGRAVPRGVPALRKPFTEAALLATVAKAA